MSLLFLSRADVEALLEPGALIDALADGFLALTEGRVNAPDRIGLEVPGAGFLLAMPGHQPGGPIAVKLVSVFEGNAALGLPSHHALIGLFDGQTGVPRAVMDGAHITALRTAGGAALSARLLARPESRVLAIVGAGVQGDAHLRLLPLVRDFAEIRIASGRPESAARLASADPRARAVPSIRAAVEGADVICLCTSSAAPVVEAGWIAPGAHLTSVGFNPPGSELDPALIRASRVFVETRRAFQPPPAGAVECVGLDPDQGAELGEVLAGRRPGRRSPDEITLYKSMGHAMEDLVAAGLVYRRALATGRGVSVTL